MRLPLPLLLAFLLQQCVRASPPVKRSYATHDYYVLEHNPSAGATLDDCTRALGVELVEQVGELQNIWLLRSTKLMSSFSPRTVSDRVLGRFEDLVALSAHSTSLYPRVGHQARAHRIVSSIKHFSPQIPRQRTKRDNSLLERAPPPVNPGDPQPEASEVIAERLGFVDPLFTKQWHIVNDQYPEHMMNVTGVWEMGITGEGIITSLVDDGLDYRSRDLADNFDAEDSYDFNDHTDLPTPILADDHHGTRCAGQIAAVKNDVCGVGLAYKSKVAGVRILSGPITDVDEASALNYGFQNVSIFSCSWGPPDDGRSMEAPGYIIEKAVVNGIQNGRAGKGSIYVFASGNGAAQGDQCNFDGYTNSIYSVTVSAVDFKGLHPYYSEPCAANMVVAYSSGSGQHIVTTDIKDTCTSGHGGTSAAAPNAAGIFALVLQARPDLTWRDIQHLCVKTAQMINPEDPDWEPMASGQLFSYKYGFGQLNAYAYVQAAQDWQLVKPQAWFHPAAIQIDNGTMLTEDGSMEGGQLIIPGGLISSFTVTQDMLDAHNFEGLEHVTVRVWISHTKRGDVEVELTSPGGVRSVLAAKRDHDRAESGFRGWRFMSVKHWGENTIGTWTIKVSDQSTEGHSGTFHGWRLMFWGSTIDPAGAKTYVLPLSQYQLPSTDEDDTVNISTPTSSKSHPKPTSGLPDDHGTAEGEASKPAFPSTSVPATATMTPTPDEGWFSDMSNLVSSQKWFFGAVGAVVLFGVCAGVFFWRRRVKRRAYAALSAGDELPMSSVSRQSGPRAKELYDAFGEVSDDEDADEETRLHGVGFHSGFLDDDDPSSAGPAPVYRDEPEGRHGTSPDVRSASPGSGSGSGESWELASQTH
ncbi:peptidase S8/S53 domain-containing protein [Suillus ampliporus]|nr:peptidase S8/S53 domain-containing protein [Suillus ampliporus]